MPFSSRAQWRQLFALQARGGVPRGTAEEMARQTPGGYHALPERARSGDLLPGGLGDRLLPSAVDPAQLREGIRVELEHTRDPRIAREIALDHLAELPDYYSRLRRMEAGAEPMQGTTPQVPYRIVQLPDGRWLGTATVQTRFGPVQVRAEANPNAEARQILARLRAGGATAGFLGDIIKTIGKGVGGLAKGIAATAKKVAQGKILQALAESAKVVTQNPLIRKAVGWASVPFLGPAGAAMVPNALKAAGAIMFRARVQKNPKARAIVQRTVAQARAGDPRAVRLAQYFTQANRILNSWGPQWFRRSAPPTYMRPGAPMTTPNGRWTATSGGQVFVPHAYSGSMLGQVVNALKMRAPYRGEGEALTLREAYRAGLLAAPR